ncbi:MAG: WhiB family transcriptional regulator [Candidatus Saccharibacteria bacterium]
MNIEQLGGAARDGVPVMTRQEAVNGLRAGIPWQSLAACVLERVDPLIFEKDLKSAAAVCGRCVVKKECLTDALRLKAVHVFRAGLTSDELLSAARRSGPRLLADQQAS